ncbi:hypothetical protein pb186bvf_000281 [Paramecium bursaria]
MTGSVFSEFVFYVVRKTQCNQLIIRHEKYPLVVFVNGMQPEYTSNPQSFASPGQVGHANTLSSTLLMAWAVISKTKTRYIIFFNKYLIFDYSCIGFSIVSYLWCLKVKQEIFQSFSCYQSTVNKNFMLFIQLHSFGEQYKNDIGLVQRKTQCLIKLITIQNYYQSTSCSYQPNGSYIYYKIIFTVIKKSISNSEQKFY